MRFVLKTLHKRSIQRILWGVSLASFLSTMHTPVHALGAEDFVDNAGPPTLLKLAAKAVAASYDLKKNLDFLSKASANPIHISSIIQELRADERGKLMEALGKMDCEERGQYTPFIQSFFEKMMNDGAAELTLYPPEDGRITGEHRFLGKRRLDFTLFFDIDLFKSFSKWNGVFGVQIYMRDWMAPSASSAQSLLRNLPISHLDVACLEGDVESSLSHLFQSGWKSLISLDFTSSDLSLSDWSKGDCGKQNAYKSSEIKSL